jgi:subtilisin family serine protease
MKRFLLTATTATLFLSLTVASIARADQDESEGSYIVVMKSSDDLDGAEAEIAKSGGRTEKRFSYAINALSVKIKHSEVARIRNNPKVLFVELDQPMFALDTQTPTPSWGLDRIDQRVLPLSNSFTASAYGAGVDVYIVDTGVSTTHTDFSGRLHSGFSAINDGRGSNDCNGHGTHVAGTAAGTTYGVAKAASVIPVRVLDCAGSGTNSGVIAGLDWIIANHTAGVAAVANMSLGGGTSLALDTAVQNAINDGVIMAVAAGNSNTNACNSSPARAANAITVGATERTDARASYSNFGSCVDIFAPGSSITSSWIKSTTATNTISGTSMASPHVAGVAAALLSANPTFSPADISSKLRSSATPETVSSVGTGSPNYLLYLDPADTTGGGTPPAVVTAPATPLIGTAVALSRKSATVSWTASDNGGSAITSFSVYAYRNGSSTVSLAQTVTGASTSATFSGLVIGSTYVFRVLATNSVGSSSLSPTSNQIIARK